MKRLDLLDYGRFFAAMMVVCYHYFFTGIVDGYITSGALIPVVSDIAKYGFLGVELFFIISGYVIFYSAINRSAAQFALARAVRLYPAFWCAVLITSSVLYFFGDGSAVLNVDQILANLTMLPKPLGYASVDGVYWTLMYELAFYAMIFFVLAVGQQKNLEKLCIVWPLLIGLAHIFDVNNYMFLGDYFTYFAAGCVLASMKNKITYLKVVSLVVAAGICIEFSSSKAILFSEAKGVEFSSWVISLVIVVYFLFFIALTNRRLQGLRLPNAAVLGAITYPLYLLHSNIGYVYLNKMESYSAVISYLSLFIIMIFLSYIFNYYIENKLHKVWKSIFTLTVYKPIVFCTKSEV